MRIVMVSQQYTPEKGGNASRIGDMAENLARQGMEVTVLSPHPTFPYGAFPRSWRRRTQRRENGVRIVNLWSWQPVGKDPSFASRIAYYLLFPIHVCLWIVFNTREFEIIISSAPPVFTAIPGLLAKVVMRKRLIYDVRDLWIDVSVNLGIIKKNGIYERASRVLESLALAHADLVSATTQLSADRLRSRYTLNAKKIMVLPNGADVDRFHPLSVPKKRQIAFVGNVGHAQDLENVVLAMKFLRERHPDIHLVIAGDGDVRSHLEKIVFDEGIVDIVDFLGVIPRGDVPRLIAESIAGVAPLKRLQSLRYAVPTKVYEYMAQAVPFIGCGAGEIVGLAEESGAGIIAENAPEDIADALAYLIENPEVAASMGRKGREHVTQHYSRSKIAARLTRALEALAIGRTEPPFTAGKGRV